MAFLFNCVRFLSTLRVYHYFVKKYSEILLTAKKESCLIKTLQLLLRVCIVILFVIGFMLDFYAIFTEC